MRLLGNVSARRSVVALYVRPWIASAVLLPLCIQFAGVGELDVLRRDLPVLYSMLDTFTLVTHEAGHFFFHFFGRFLGLAGGTLLQLLVPVLLVAHFLVHDYRLGTQLALLWLGQSCNSVSIYAADARKRILPLLGDNLEGHDWHNMLSMLGVLEWDHAIGMSFQVLCWAAFAALLLAPLYVDP